jgi:GrpB-like predicted nucleotidyltransferase (UPF0157 family)
LLEYDSGWALRFEELAARVRAFLGDSVCHVEHIGSTAVPGLTAKPVIDLDVAVRSAIDVPPSIQRLAQAGYLHEGNLGVEGREAFRWPPGEERHHLYLLVYGAPEFQRHLAFRDALRADSALRDAYARLKRSLALRHSNDRAAYNAGKGEFIEGTRGSHQNPILRSGQLR